MNDDTGSTGDETSDGEVVESIVAAFQLGPLTPLGRQVTAWMRLARVGEARAAEEHLMRTLGEEPPG